MDVYPVAMRRATARKLIDYLTVPDDAHEWVKQALQDLINALDEAQGNQGTVEIEISGETMDLPE
jgi:hypothetical protein